jgi:hypothetical protein
MHLHHTTDLDMDQIVRDVGLFLGFSLGSAPKLTAMQYLTHKFLVWSLWSSPIYYLFVWCISPPLRSRSLVLNEIILHLVQSLFFVLLFVLGYGLEKSFRHKAID